ncbi:hypothetical protein HHI36_015978 [Cryptolaemus montrouzieri]|uniref:Uncharacterized protein n=1 Tax=Cryptolaemus montrouzieri TaxID=559131 RepID=A0ABD2N7P2_9CUCU
MSGSWRNLEDITRDLFKYSDLEYNADMLKEAPPKSIIEYRARTSLVKNPGLFDGGFKEDVEVFISGRGKYHQDRIIKPGLPVEPIPEDDFNLKKKLREVSGLGYSNEIIERNFSANSPIMEIEKHESDFVIPDLKLYATSSRPSSNCASSSPSPTHIRKIKSEEGDEEKTPPA